MSSFIKRNTWPHAVQMNQMLWLNHLYYFSLYEKERKFGPDSIFCSHSSQELWLCEKAWMEQPDERGSLHTPPTTACIYGEEKGMWQHITLPLTMHLLSVVNPPISPCSRRRLWLLSESWDDPLVWAASLTGWCVLSAHWSYKAVWLMDVGVSAGLGGDTGEAWNGLWTHQYFMVGRTQTEEKSTQKMELLIPWNEGNCEGLGSELQPLTWEAEMGGMPLNFWLARLEPAPGQDEFSFG